MTKWLMIALVPLIFIGGGLLFLKFTSSDEDTEEIVTSDTSIKNILGTSVQSDVDSVVEDSKTTLKDKVQETADSLSELIDQKADQVIEKVFGKEETVEEKTTVSLSDTNTSLMIDFKNHGNQKISLKKGVKYQLKFKNIPDNFCVFIKNQKVKLDSNLTAEVKLDNTGNYPLSVDICESDQKNLGEFLVE